VIVATRVFGMTGTGCLDHNRPRGRFVLMIVVRVTPARLIHPFVPLATAHGEAPVRYRW
jgi:hypothetical protein